MTGYVNRKVESSTPSDQQRQRPDSSTMLWHSKKVSAGRATPKTLSTVRVWEWYALVLQILSLIKHNQFAGLDKTRASILNIVTTSMHWQAVLATQYRYQPGRHTAW